METSTVMVHFDQVVFSMTTTDPSGQVIATTVTLEADDVPMEYVVGALTAGSSRRTNWQNDKKATKKTPAKPIPTEVSMKYGEWIGKNKVAAVIMQTRKLTSDELYAQAKADPKFSAEYAAFLAWQESQKPNP